MRGGGRDDVDAGDVAEVVCGCLAGGRVEVVACRVGETCWVMAAKNLSEQGSNRVRKAASVSFRVRYLCFGGGVFGDAALFWNLPARICPTKKGVSEQKRPFAPPHPPPSPNM